MAEMNVMPESQATDAEVEMAYDLIATHVPTNARIIITQTDGFLISRFLIRVIYTSHKSGRTISITAKGDALPSAQGELLAFYTSQLPANNREVASHFSRIAWLEKRARQDQFLFSKDNNRVSEKDAEKDMIPLPYNQEGATYESY